MNKSANIFQSNNNRYFEVDTIMLIIRLQYENLTNTLAQRIFSKE